jgi:hypothetical protein
MALSRFVCPECGKAVRPAEPVEEAERVRCPGCRAVFVPEPDDAPETTRRTRRSGNEESESDEPRRGAKGDGEPRKKGGGLLPVALIGGGIALVLFVCCGGVGVGIYLLVGHDAGGDGGGGGGGKQVARADLDRIEAYASLAEVEAALGKGEQTDDVDGRLRLLYGKGPEHVWHAWGKGDQIFVCFRKGRSGAWRVVCSAFVQDAPGKPLTFGVKEVILFGMDVDDLAEEKPGKLEASPRWKKGEAARKTLLGWWTQPLGVNYRFEQDGTCSGTLEGARHFTGTYRFLDDGQVEMTLRFGREETRRRKFLVAEDELILIDPETQSRQRFKRVEQDR